MKTYEISDDRGETYIRCLQCGKASYHPSDVRARYCGNCKLWHVWDDDQGPLQTLIQDKANELVMLIRGKSQDETKLIVQGFLMQALASGALMERQHLAGGGIGKA